MAYQFSKRQWFVAAIVGATIAVATGFIYYYVYVRCDIRDYNPRTDRSTLIRLFNENKYWLTTNEEYDIEHMLDTKSPNDYQPEFKGKLAIKVTRVNGNPVGFVAYYKKKFYEGMILFLAVDKKYRGKSYATKLLKYAINALFKDHALVVRLVTRTNNYAAMKVYERAGMKETERANGFVYFEIRK